MMIIHVYMQLACKLLGVKCAFNYCRTYSVEIFFFNKCDGVADFIRVYILAVYMHPSFAAISTLISVIIHTIMRNSTIYHQTPNLIILGLLYIIT